MAKCKALQINFFSFFLFTKLKQVCKLSEFTSNTSNKCQNESLQTLRKNAVKMTIKDSDVKHEYLKTFYSKIVYLIDVFFDKISM